MRILLHRWGRVLARATGVLILMLLPVCYGVGVAFAQESGEAEIPAVEETVPAAQEAESDPAEEVIQEEATDVPEEPSVDPPVVEQPPPEQQPVETAIPEEPSANPTTIPTAPSEEPSPTSTPTPVPVVPELSFSAAIAPECLPRSGVLSVSAGGELIVDCAVSITLTGANLDPSAIALDWNISAVATGDLGVQLLVPSVDIDGWPSARGPSAERSVQTSYGGSPSDAPLETLNDVVTLAFSLSIVRPACSNTPGSVEIMATGAASMPATENAVVTDETTSRSSTVLQPDLAPIESSPPSVSILAVSIDPVTFSLIDTQVAGTLTILVESPTLQCHASTVSVSVLAVGDMGFDGAASVAAIGTPQESTISGAQGSSGEIGSNLANGLMVSAVPIGASAGSYVQTIEFDLTIPSATSVGAYQLIASAVVEPAG